MARFIASEGERIAQDRAADIKSTVHLGVAACRQLELVEPPLPKISLWASACGQRLFNTPH